MESIVINLIWALTILIIVAAIGITIYKIVKQVAQSDRDRAMYKAIATDAQYGSRGLGREDRMLLEDARKLLHGRLEPEVVRPSLVSDESHYHSGQ